MVTISSGGDTAKCLCRREGGISAFTAVGTQAPSCGVSGPGGIGPGTDGCCPTSTARSGIVDSRGVRMVGAGMLYERTGAKEETVCVWPDVVLVRTAGLCVCKWRRPVHMRREIRKWREPSGHRKQRLPVKRLDLRRNLGSEQPNQDNGRCSRQTRDMPRLWRVIVPKKADV